jgi:hypothetical protein
MKLTGENRSTRGKIVPMPLCPPQISHGLNPGLRGEMPATIRLSHGTAMGGTCNYHYATNG